MTKMLMQILGFSLAVAFGAIGHWVYQSHFADKQPLISLESASVRVDSEFLIFEYLFKCRSDLDPGSYVLIHASVLDNENTTSRYMGHDGELNGNGHKSGSIQERLHILDKLANPYLVVVATITAQDGSVIERRPFVMPIPDAEQGDSEGTPLRGAPDL